MSTGQVSNINRPLSGPEDSSLTFFLENIYRETGYDFRRYKRGTVTRRLDRRLHATGSADYAAYALFLEDHPEEFPRMVNDLTISVSEFFRNRITFQQLAGQVLPGIIRDRERPGNSRLRIWSAACARGEEPYSVAITLRENLKLSEIPVTIYATDISRPALRAARAGRYKVDEVKTVPPDFLDGYFLPSEHGYEVRDEIRGMVDFACHDLTSPHPPPYRDLDCIFCCNILIYWQRSLQETVLRGLYDSLSSSGYLVLGEAETLTRDLHGKLYCLDSKAKIYRKVA